MIERAFESMVWVYHDIASMREGHYVHISLLDATKNRLEGCGLLIQWLSYTYPITKKQFMNGERELVPGWLYEDD